MAVSQCLSQLLNIQEHLIIKEEFVYKVFILHLVKL